LEENIEMYKRFIKRLLDLILSGMAIIFLLPVLLFVAILVRVKLGSPVLFKQERPGYKGKVFRMFKFRTMLDPQTKDGRVLTDKERLECIEKGIDILTDEERLTKLGRFLRAASLDELPELWNIFIGDMSIVGPRPLATIYLPSYTKEEMRRHDVRPGLTGWAQVNGRNSATWEKRFEYDVYYVDHCSFTLDVKIFFQTISVVFHHKNIGQGEEKPESFNTVRQREWDEGTVIKDR
jgi:lipopolysaccharide/colanic/teichoic acid biosynthesis glycosyltransferase